MVILFPSLRRYKGWENPEPMASTTRLSTATQSCLVSGGYMCPKCRMTGASASLAWSQETSALLLQYAPSCGLSRTLPERQANPKLGAAYCASGVWWSVWAIWTERAVQLKCICIFLSSPLSLSDCLYIFKFFSFYYTLIAANTQGLERLTQVLIGYFSK